MRGIMKSHYEIITKHYTFKGFRDLLDTMAMLPKKYYSFEEMAMFGNIKTTKLPKTALTMLNLLFHIYYFELYGKKIYEISNGLSELLYQTSLSKVPMELLQLPYRSFILVVPTTLFRIKESTGWHEVYTIYVTNSEIEPYKLRILCCGRPNENSVDVLDDALYYFNLDLSLGSKDDVFDMLQSNLKKIREAEQEKLKKYGAEITSPYIEPIFKYVLNCVLYITGADSDVKYINESLHLVKKIKNVKNKAKKRKLEQKIRLPRYIVGGNIKLTREEREHYKNERLGIRKQKVRTLVQGHWRNQAYGKNRKLRQLKWINPFWRGPSFAEVVNRKHRVI